MNTEVEIKRFIINDPSSGMGCEKIDSDEPLISSGILDSLNLLRLVNFIEKQFGVTVEDGELIHDNFETINCIKAFLEKKQQAA
jgi:acyl carrier protein